MKIVRGNDFFLRVPVRMRYIHSAPTGREILERDFPLGDASTLKVYVVNSDGCLIPMPFTIDPQAGHVLLIHVKHCLCPGRYGIEIHCTYDGRELRCYEKRRFRLVEDDGKSYLSPAIFEGGQEYILKACSMLWAAPSYPCLELQLNGMRLVMTGTVDNGEMMLDENGKLVLVYY